MALATNRGALPSSAAVLAVALDRRWEAAAMREKGTEKQVPGEAQTEREGAPCPLPLLDEYVLQ